MSFRGDPVRLLVIPGLRDSGPAHWQTWLQGHFARHSVRVVQDDWESIDLARWVQRIEATVARHPGARWVAAAHSFGCLALMRYLSEGGRGVRAALLVAPADPAKFGITQKMPQSQIGIPSVLLASENDPWMKYETTVGWARVWGSQLISLGDAGHINTEAGFGPLPQAKLLVETMVQRVERESRIDRAHLLELSFAI